MSLRGTLVVVDHRAVDDASADARDSPDAPRRGRPCSGASPERPPDPVDVPTPEAYRTTVDAEYRQHAVDQGCARVREIEENVITPAMRRIESADPARHLVGLDCRLKGADRLSDKVESHLRANPNISYDNAFAKIKDAIRFTFEYTESRYTAGVLADCGRLEEAGFKRVDRRNTWATEEYKGINSRWQAPEGDQLFEVQFHTRASFEAKQETHWAYEKIRDPRTPKSERDALMAYQRESSSRIPIPPGAPDIPDYR